MHSFCKLLLQRKIAFANSFLQCWLGCWALQGTQGCLAAIVWIWLLLFQSEDYQAVPTPLEFKTQAYLWSFILILKGFAQQYLEHIGLRFLAESCSAVIPSMKKVSVCLSICPSVNLF